MLTRAIALAGTVYALCGSAITLLGWIGGFEHLTDWDGDGIAMLANTSIAMFASSIAMLMLLVNRGGNRWTRGIILMLATVVTVLGVLTILQHMTGWDLGIDRLLIEPLWGERAAASPGRMGPPASASFLMLGSAMWILAAARRPEFRKVASLIALASTILPIISAVAYLYGADQMYSSALTGIAQQTAIMLVCLTVALVIAIDDHGLGAMLRRDDAGGTLIRHLLPISIGLLLTTGWFEDFGEKQAWYDGSFGNAALTVVRVVMFTALLWWTAVTIQHQIERRRSAESELSEQQQRLRALVDAIPNLAWMANADGWIYWYNQRWYDYTGTTPKDMVGWGWQSVHDPEVLPRVLRDWKRSIATGTPLDTVFPLRGADGEYRTFLTRVVPMRDDSGTIVQWFGTNTDITEQKSAQDVLSETNRMKDEFLATLSHELRTPMSAILGWSQLLRTNERTNGEPADLDHGLEVIERNARLQSQIIEDLLDMNRIISGKVRLDVQSISLSDVVQAAIEAIRPAAAAKDLRLQCVCDPNISSVRGDPSRLQQVFYNLLTNAVKFTPRSGKIQVHCARVNSHLEVSVSDTGIGIKEEFLPHVFERFRQQDASTTRMYGGLGLGLGIVKHLVELHGGSVHVASDGENQGTTFTVHLPVSIAVLPPMDERGIHDRRHPAATTWKENDAAEDAAAAADRKLITGIRALIVDDEADARDMLRRLLERHGATVTLAGSAAEALAVLPSTPIDILVFDIGMPVMNGYDLIKAVRQLPAESGGKTPAIALTAFARSEDRTKSLRAGFQMHLSKPVETVELLASIANLAGIQPHEQDSV